ncbi:MAG: endonuclease/exonuclease/phosphatase family protein [Gammaproteobacteria bacterium]|nr:hypothetical protein [Rhodocyclaceae bacterium]MBU3908812.1 endonuclease/exonuclease/phosphatase family protein [Gammaproteobacteria bacterium]MBU3988421.1 endonuclease/exonuclease/phosphatase family protein [Gammaproteobacteria bacterium]MBU4003647.1 endonuclease/exonuclease/phosphatase family protein [Gammaproteobacteria bacterium]MBU4021761.1 endonuclease/exonuclease/phosphatase family protein [Gammaproteobacteria bacterium]
MRLVTINTWKCDGDYHRRMDALECQLAALQPDIVAIQESFATVDGTIVTAARLGRHLGLASAFIPERRKPRNVDGISTDSYSGLALLSRWEYTAHIALPLPSSSADGGRSAQLAIIQVGASRLIIANVHLSHLPDGSALRREQLATVLHHPYFGTDFAAALITGDFNAVLSSAELSTYLASPWQLIDAYASGGGKTKITHRGSNGQGSDLDHILALPDQYRKWPMFSDSRLVLDAPDLATGILPSDHAGVMTTLLLG